MPSRRWKAAYNTLRISQESWIYAAHKSCLRHFLWCFVVWQSDGESLIVWLWWRQLILSHADTERCVPAWTGNNRLWPRPYRGASERRTDRDRRKWASHNTSHHRSADTPQKLSHSSAHQPIPSSGPSQMQTSKAKTVFIHMVSYNIILPHITVAVIIFMICFTMYLILGTFCASVHWLCVVIQLKRLCTDGLSQAITSIWIQAVS